MKSQPRITLPSADIHTQARIWGVGVDCCEIARMQRAYVRRGEGFARRILTADEMQEFARRLQHGLEPAIAYLAKRFAAKEAIAKALGTGIRGILGWQSLSIVNTTLGQPEVRTHGAVAQHCAREGLVLHISISDDAGLALAYCVAEQLTEKQTLQTI